MTKLTKLKDIITEIPKKNILLRTDFNVPLRDGCVFDDWRIKESIPTITKILENQPKGLIMISHMGRPRGTFVKDLSLRPVSDYLEKHLKTRIRFIESGVCQEAVEICSDLKNGEVAILENLRFDRNEEKKYLKESSDLNEHSQFVHNLNKLGHVYVNDAFGCLHRAHSSITDISVKIKSIGLLVEKELMFFDKLINGNDKKGRKALILGGAKVEDKIPMILNLLPKIDDLLIGGGMAFTFISEIEKVQTGKSLINIQAKSYIPEILAQAQKYNVKVHFPVDYLCGKSPKDESPKLLNNVIGIAESLAGYDIGPKTIDLFKNILKESDSILINGTMGVSEEKAYSNGTYNVLKELSKKGKNGGLVIVCGGDTVSSVRSMGLESGISHISTGGGASLKYLEENTLTGLSLFS